MAALVAGILAWQLLPQGNTAKAVEDACNGLADLGEGIEHASFDLTTSGVMTRGPGTEPELGTGHIRYSFDPYYARHETETWDGGTRHSETITMVQPDQSDSSETRNSDNTEATYSVVTYIREYDENGNAAGWTTQSEPVEVQGDDS